MIIALQIQWLGSSTISFYSCCRIPYTPNNITDMDNTEYYKILEVSENATPKEIASAYFLLHSRFRRLALKWHPKLSKADPNTAYSNLCKVSEAY